MNALQAAVALVGLVVFSAAAAGCAKSIEGSILPRRLNWSSRYMSSITDGTPASQSGELAFLKVSGLNMLTSRTPSTSRLAGATGSSIWPQRAHWGLRCICF
jgi:hypothetical protein